LERGIEHQGRAQSAVTIKLMLLWAGFCFYNLMLAVRYYNHTARLINVPPEHHASLALHRPGYLVRMPPITDMAPGVNSCLM
jgi:hypothetical protein